MKIDLEWPTKIHNPCGFQFHKDSINFIIHIDLKFIKKIHNHYGSWISHGFLIQMDYEFLCNGYGFRILKNKDFGMDMNLVSNLSGPTGCTPIHVRLFNRNR